MGGLCISLSMFPWLCMCVCTSTQLEAFAFDLKVNSHRDATGSDTTTARSCGQTSETSQMD